MSIFRITSADVATIIAITVICVPILLFMPNFEQSRTEARIAMAYIEVRQIRDSVTAPAADISLKVQDPWGTPYRVVVLPEGRLRVLSSGPNQSSPTGTVDSDDIYSDMPTNPIREAQGKQQRQILVVLGITMGMWCLLTGFYLRFRH